MSTRFVMRADLVRGYSIHELFIDGPVWSAAAAALLTQPSPDSGKSDAPQRGIRRSHIAGLKNPAFEWVGAGLVRFRNGLPIFFEDVLFDSSHGSRVCPLHLHFTD